MLTWAQRIGRRARAIRTAKGLGFEAVAKKARLSIGALSEIETGKREARLRGYARLAKALDVPLAELLGVQARDEGDPAGEGR
jgi:transcriptional regulator with XRE-family HTH domain